MTATVKISALPVATAPDPNADVTLLVQGGTTKKVAIGQLGGLLGYYQSVQGADFTTASITPAYVDVDTTNIKVTFVTPPSGKVLVVYNFAGYGNTSNLLVGVREGLVDVAASGVAFNGGGNFINSSTIHLPITGLTPGSSHTYKMSYASGGGGGNVTIFGSTNAGLGPSMYIWAVPG